MGRMSALNTGPTDHRDQAPTVPTRTVVLSALVVVLALVILTATANGGPTVSGPRVLVIGDSLLHISEVDVQTALAADHWQAHVEGHSGASMESWDPFVGPIAGTVRPDVAVVELGTNDCDTYCPNVGTYIDKIMTALVRNGAGAVLWVNVQRAPVYPRHSDYVNYAIEQASVRWPQMRLVDLATFTDAHPEWRGPDGLHFNAAGQQAFADLIRTALHPWATPA